MRRSLVALLLLGLAGACRRPAEPPHADGLSPPPAPAAAQADSLYAAGEYASARQLWRSALADAWARGDSAEAARLLTSIGLAARNLGEYQESRTAGEEALALKLRLRQRRELFRSYNALGLLAWDQGRDDDAMALYDLAGAAAAALGDSLSLAKAANNLGLIRKTRGEFLAAREGFVRARDVSRQVGDSVLLGRALDNLAMLDLQLGDPLSAMAWIREARSLARRTGDAEAEENALGQLATAYQALGQPQAAFAVMDSALALAEAHGLRRRMAEDLKLLGDYYAAAGDHRRALGYYGRAQTMNAGLALPEDQGNTLRDEAWSYRALGHRDTAQARAQRALTLHQAGGFRLAELEDQLLLAQLAADRHDEARAAQALGMATRISREVGAPAVTARASVAAARLHDQASRYRQVLVSLDSAADGLTRLTADERWEPDALKARAYAHLGAAAAAESAGRRAVASIERVRAGYGSGALRTSFLSERSDVYADLVMVLLGQGRTGDAFEVADAARGRALLEHLAAARREVEKAGGAAADLYRAEQLLRRIDALTRQLQEKGAVPPGERGAALTATTRSLEERLDQARAEYEELITRVAGEHTGPATLLGATTLSASTVRRGLRWGELLVEYFVMADRVVLFAADANGIRALEHAVPAAELVSRVRLARDLTGAPGAADAADSVLRSLHRILVEPLETAAALQGVSRLIVVPHGPLAYLPFAALRDRRQAPLVDRYAILVLPSAATLAALRSRTDASVRAAGGVVLAPLPEELPATRAEVEDVRRVLGGRALLAGAATEAAFRRALSSASVVHIATHGIMNPMNPMFSRLELAPGRGGSPEDDGRLEVHEVLGLPVGAELVFLSGCETGKGAAWRTGFERGEDFVTLSQAFLYAGAHNVVATLWRVDDEGAAAFAREFYRAWRGGDPVEALATAQRAMLRQSAYRAPYYWAAYQVSGSGFPAAAGSLTVGRTP